MANSSTYYAVYTEQLTDADRNALTLSGFKVYPDGVSVSNAWFVGGGETPPSEFTVRQVVRMEAGTAEEAKSRVVEALGRSPEGLAAFRANESPAPGN